jgi:hypothetical protein
MRTPTLSSELLAAGRVIREPVSAGNGYWAGAPGVFHAADEKAFYLTYRIRRPRGVEPERGGEARIARSTDLEHFEDLWIVTKDKFCTASMERCFVIKGRDGQWRYFTSFVDPADGRWCVEVLKAPAIAALDPAKAVRVFSAAAHGLEGVKDPWIMEANGVYHMFLSVAVATPKTTDASHATLDIFNTGECVSATALAVSRDLDRWDWQGVVFQPKRPGWDQYCHRINSVVRRGGRYVAFYDGSASERENYEERTALAVSTDLRAWQSQSPDGPALTSPHASGSLRYLNALILADEAVVFYEFARPDGAHDLRMVRLPATGLPA